MNPLIRRVVVTGVGAVTPLGGDTNTSWKNLIDGKSGASSITRFDATGFPCTIACEVPLGAGISSSDGTFNPDDWISTKDQKKVDTFILYGLIHVGAGAGIVADSNPESEWLECKQKSKVFLDALEMIS